MADTLLHISIANRIASQPQLVAPIREIIAQRKNDYLMGSVAFDLPYYDALIRTGIRTLLHLPIKYHPFGQTIHEGRCKETCIALADAANNPSLLAFAFGALTHFAVDIVFHREIEKQIQNNSISHDTLERQIGLLCHLKLLGHTGVGTPYAKESTTLAPTDNWADFLSATLSRIYSDTPTAAVFQKWAKGLRQFGSLYSKSWYPWLNTRPPQDVVLKKLARQMRREAIEKAIAFLNAAGAFKEGALSLAQYQETLPALRMSDGLCDDA